MSVFLHNNSKINKDFPRMNLHEYQAKQLFGDYGIPLPAGKPVTSVTEALAAAEALGGDAWVVKAQVHAGGRGKAGGVRKVTSPTELEAVAKALIGTRLVTHQSGPGGQPVEKLLIEMPCHIARELYLACLVDRARERVVVMASTEGGMDIEAVAANTPEKILKAFVDPVAGLQAYQCRELAFALGLADKAENPLLHSPHSRHPWRSQVGAFTQILLGLYKLFLERDLSLVEINPLVVTDQGGLLALDGKINIDDNALYRQKSLAALRDVAQEDAKETKAREHDLNYIALDGNIGCMVNGAGLAMATMDLIKLHGGMPANFLDVGGGTTKERVAEAFKLILSDLNVKAILVNIFGGIVRCDLIAEGIISAVKEVGIRIPVVVRLEGTNVEQGRALLKHSGLAIEAADSLTDAAKRTIAAVAK
jgi:succinyl-CoA synthetase beta subunit